MNIEKQIEIAKKLVEAGVPTVFHSAELIAVKGNKQAPAYAVGDEYIRLFPADNKGTFGYIRSMGAASIVPFEIGGCVTSYKSVTPYKIVVYSRDAPISNDVFLMKILRACRLQHVSITGYSTDKLSIAKGEAPSENIVLSATSFLASVNIIIKDVISFDNCPTNCVVFDNPIKCE